MAHTDDMTSVSRTATSCRTCDSTTYGIEQLDFPWFDQTLTVVLCDDCGDVNGVMGMWTAADGGTKHFDVEKFVRAFMESTE